MAPGETRAHTCRHRARGGEEPRLLCGGLHGLGAGGADHALSHRGAGLPPGHVDREELQTKVREDFTITY